MSAAASAENGGGGIVALLPQRNGTLEKSNQVRCWSIY
jgi:hypothetical protein